MFGLQDTARIVAKIFIIGIFFALMFSFISQIDGIFKSLFTTVANSFSSVNGLNLGYFAGAVGLVDFLNSLLQSLLVASKIFLSSIFTIMVFKFISKMFNTAMRI